MENGRTVQEVLLRCKRQRASPSGRGVPLTQAFQLVAEIKNKMRLTNRKRAALLILAMLGALSMSAVLWQRHRPEDEVCVQYVCRTNIPNLGPKALFNISNRTDRLIGVPGHGHVGPGESVTLPFDIPPGTGSWRVSVEWQCLELSFFDVFMNRSRWRVEEALGRPRYVDAWFPSMQVSQSPEVAR
jgi:hypothetical protein